jgi:hypothetical protein
LLLVVIKNEGGGDNLFLLRRVGDHFESLQSMACGFVELTGKYKVDSLGPIALDALPEWTELQHQEIGKTPFWWGGKGPDEFAWRTLGIRSFLGITEPLFRAFKTGRETRDGVRNDRYFGLWDKDEKSLVLAKDDSLISYGNATARNRLLQHVRRWVELGMSTAASFALQVYRRDQHVAAGENQWIVKRSESQFLWSLDGKSMKH